MNLPKAGLLNLRSWAGNTRQVVMVVDETPKRYRIRALTETRLGGHGRLLEPGELALVPKSAITFWNTMNCALCGCEIYDWEESITVPPKWGETQYGTAHIECARQYEGDEDEEG